MNAAIEPLILKDEPFKNHNPLRVGGNVQEWICIYDENTLQGILKKLKKEKRRWVISWPFQDMLCKDGGYDGVVIRLCGQFEQITYLPDTVVMGSASLWASLKDSFANRLGSWSGSVGALFANSEEHCLKGCNLTLRWLSGKGIVEKHYEKGVLPCFKKSKNILLSLTLKSISSGKLRSPTRNGHIMTLTSKDKIESTFKQYQLCGIRLKTWLLSRENPGQVIQLGGGSCRDLLILHQGLKERIKKIGGKTLILCMSPFGKEKHNAGRKK